MPARQRGRRPSPRRRAGQARRCEPGAAGAVSAPGGHRSPRPRARAGRSSPATALRAATRGQRVESRALGATSSSRAVWVCPVIQLIQPGRRKTASAKRRVPGTTRRVGQSVPSGRKATGTGAPSALRTEMRRSEPARRCSCTCGSPASSTASVPRGQARTTYASPATSVTVTLPSTHGHRRRLRGLICMSEVFQAAALGHLRSPPRGDAPRRKPIHRRWISAAARAHKEKEVSYE